jgi:hypothetical protein
MSSRRGYSDSQVPMATPRLNNEDFRKILLTPRHPDSGEEDDSRFTRQTPRLPRTLFLRASTQILSCYPLPEKEESSQGKEARQEVASRIQRQSSRKERGHC